MVASEFLTSLLTAAYSDNTLAPLTNPQHRDIIHAGGEYNKPNNQAVIGPRRNSRSSSLREAEGGGLKLREVTFTQVMTFQCHHGHMEPRRGTTAADNPRKEDDGV